MRCPPRPARPRSPRRMAWKSWMATGALAACIMHLSEAHAEPSAWLAVGGGYGLQYSDSRQTFDRATALSFSIGVGTSPTSSVVFGGLVRTTTYFTLGTDLGLSARIASGGFARGQWGLALDVGPTWRGWGVAADYGRFPMHAMLTGGAPWGVQLGIGTQLFDLSGEPAARGLVALLEVDLLRLTVMRQGATDRWWENPAPAGGRMRGD